MPVHPNPSTTPRLRALTPADFEPVAKLAHTIWLAHYTTIITREQVEYMLRGRFTPQNLQRYIGAQDRWMDVLTLDNELVGYCSYALANPPSEMKLEQLYLLPTLHGRGLGKHMLQHVERRAREEHCRTLMLTVNKHNEQAIRIYRAAGFQVRDEVVIDIGQGYVMDDYMMEKRVTSEE